MKLTMAGIKDREVWEKAGIQLPGYDVEEVSEKARKAPRWVHFGIGIFSVSLSEELQMVFWKKGLWTGDSPVWRPLTMMWQIRFMLHMIIWD